jgi:acyl-CoA hydrolase
MSQSTTDDLTEVHEGPVGEPAIRTITMPLDTNPEGDILAGG